MNPTQTATRMDAAPQAVAPQRHLRPVSRERSPFAGREMPPDRLAVFSSMQQKDPRANASRPNELCMQDFL